MSLTTSEMTPADIAAVTNNGCNNNCNDGWGGGWSSWIILFLIFGMFGWGGFGGFGGYGGYGGGMVQQGYDTRADIQRGFDNQSVMNKLNGLENGICDGFYAQNTNMLTGFGNLTLNNAQNTAQLQNSMNQGFNGLNTAMITQGYETRLATQGLGSQLADCCCQTQRAIDGVNYNMATNTCAIQNSMCNSTRDIIESQNNGTRAILDALTAQRIEAKDQRIAEQAQTIAQLQLSASQSNQNAVLMAAMDANRAEILRRSGHDCPSAAYIVQPPTPVTFPTNCCGQVNYGNNCGNSCC